MADIIPWEKFVEVGEAFGVHWATLIVFLWYVFRQNTNVLYRALDDRQKEIDRLAADNRLYRDVYLLKIAGITPEEISKIRPPDDKRKTKGD